MSKKNKAIFNTLLTYFLVIVGLSVIKLLAYLRLLGNNPIVSIIINALSQIVLIGGLPIILFTLLQKQKFKTSFKFFGFKKFSAKAVALSIIIGVFIFFLNSLVAGFFYDLLGAIGYKLDASPQAVEYPFYMLIIDIFFSAVLPAICEEICHRGLLLKGLSAAGARKAIIISSILFGLVHMRITQFFYAAILGLIMGYVALLCDSIYPTIIFHFMNNALDSFLRFSQVNGGLFGRFMSLVEGFIRRGFFGYLFGILLAILICCILFDLIKALFLETTYKNVAVLQSELYKELARKDYLADIEESKASVSGLKTNGKRDVNLEQVYIDKNIELGYMTELDKQILSNEKFKMHIVNKILLACCFIVTAAWTILSLVEGLI